MNAKVSLQQMQDFIARGRVEADRVHAKARCEKQFHPLTQHVRNLGRCLNEMRCECGDVTRTVDSSD
jgi:hypothetical protein